MKAISLQAGGTPRVSAVFKSVINFVRTNRLVIAILAAVVAYLGCMFNSDAAVVAGAAIAITSIRPLAEKGGEK